GAVRRWNHRRYCVDRAVASAWERSRGRRRVLWRASDSWSGSVCFQYDTTVPNVFDEEELRAMLRDAEPTVALPTGEACATLPGAIRDSVSVDWQGGGGRHEFLLFRGKGAVVGALGPRKRSAAPRAGFSRAAHRRRSRSSTPTR